MKILFITDYWFPNKTTNAICVENVAEALKVSGNEVYVSAYSSSKNPNDNPSEYNNIVFEFIRPSIARQLLSFSQWAKKKWQSKLYALLGKTINRTRRMFLLPFYPIVSLALPHRWSRQIEEIIDKNKIDTVVSVNAPEETIYTGYLVKKRNSDINWIIYNLDAGTNILPGTSFEMLKKKLQAKAIRWEQKVFAIADKIIVMEGHSDYYTRNAMPFNKDKLVVADVPLLKVSCENENQLKASNSDIEIWVYTGNMNGVFYDPTKLCELFNYYSRLRRCELHLYGPSDHRDYLQDIASKNSNIIWHGSVSHDDVQQAQKDSDVLVYYKCEDMDSISGKLYEYLACNKPILFIGPANDINSRNLSKYAMGKSIDITLPVEIQANIAYEFLKMQKGIKKGNIADIVRSFTNSLPETTAKIITDI